MKITWLAHACFKIETKGKIIAMDPYNSKIGLTLPKGLTAEIVTISHQHVDHNDPSEITGVKQVLDKPGDYVIEGIDIRGVQAYHDDSNGSMRGPNTVFVIESEGIRVCHLGDLGQILTADQLSEIGHVDVLMIPVGGVVTLGPMEAMETISLMNPKVILPMHFQIGERKSRFVLKGVEEFLSVMKIPVEQKEELVITKEQLDNSLQKIILLRSDNQTL